VEATEAVGCILTQQPEREPSLARSMVDCPAGAVLIAGPLCQPSRCEPGTARAPIASAFPEVVTVMRCNKVGSLAGGLQLKLRALRLVTSAATNSKTGV
jgi:hypothetical protein